ncbi:FeoA family protein [Undibacterium seohonense]|jgi:ferrous iron transport protein A|nr:FeoA family protein [Undibacterium seohonense]
MNSINIDMATPANFTQPAPAASQYSPSLSISAEVKKLADIAIGEKCVVRQLVAPSGMPEWLTQLEDIGFIAGEPVTLMARGAFGGDPLVVRIGLSTFALRKAEAACVLVDVLEDSSMNKVAA